MNNLIYDLTKIGGNQIAALFLYHNYLLNPGEITLFSSSKVERIIENLRKFQEFKNLFLNENDMLILLSRINYGN